MACNRSSISRFLAMYACAFIVSSAAQAQDVMPETALQPPVVEGQAPQSQDETSDIDKILQDEQLRIGLQESFQRQGKLRAPDIDPSVLGTLLFTPWQYALLQEAKARFLTRAPDQSEIMASGDNTGAVMGPREIKLGGIVYRAPMEWVVWVNSQRITPDAIPKEVLDIRVAKDFVELKWFDSFTNLVYPIRMRAHQRFNLDSRIFLPGDGTQ